MDQSTFLIRFLSSLVGGNHPVRFAFALALSRGIFEAIQAFGSAYPESGALRALQGVSWLGWIGFTFAAAFLWVLLRPMNEGDRRLLAILDHALSAGRFSEVEKRQFYRLVIGQVASLATSHAVTNEQTEVLASKAAQEVQEGRRAQLNP